MAPRARQTSTSAREPNPLSVFFLKPKRGYAYADDREVAQVGGEGVQVGGSLTVIVGATDKSSRIDSVEIAVDGKTASKSGAAPFSWRWETDEEDAGPHQLTVSARDQAGNEATAEIVVSTIGR